jgi:hypothetical protein
MTCAMSVVFEYFKSGAFTPPGRLLAPEVILDFLVE